MNHHESRLKVNGEWRNLLIVSSNTPEVFGNTITFEVGNSTETYHVNGVFRQFQEDGLNFYWFLPTIKTITYIKDEIAQKTAEKNAANIDYISMMTGVEIPTQEEI